MKYQIKGKGKVTLSKKDFVASGGEGSIYAQGNKAFKIYLKPEKMIPEQKIEDLSSINNYNVIKPEELVLVKGTPVGYSMRYVKDTYALCQLFTPAFKKRNGLSQDMILNIIKNFQSNIEDIHLSGSLVVDLNEMNFLVDNGFKEVYCIDVDSYQTVHYPATALMDSVKDWHANGKWTKESDWFSWAIVSFQLFMGIHPYKGKHTTLKNLPDRMKGNVSVFHKDVTVPKMVSNFDIIPKVLRDWYQAVFDNGFRGKPPFDLNTAVRVISSMEKINSTDQLEISDIFNIDFGSDVVDFIKFGNFNVVQTEDRIFVLSGSTVKKELKIGQNQKFAIGTTDSGRLVLASVGTEGEIGLMDIVSGKSIPIILKGEDIMGYGGRLYTKNGENIIEIIFVDHGQNCLASTRIVANVMQKATKLFDGVVIQDMLGSWFISVFPKSGTSYQVKLGNLDGYKIIDAKFDTNVLMVVGYKNGEYDRFVYKFRSDFSDYTIWEEKNISYSGINFVRLDNRVCACINESSELILFSSSPSQSGTKVIRDSVVNSGMLLFKKGCEVLFSREKRIFKLSTKK